MSNRPETAILVPISDISKEFIGLKIRTVGHIDDYNHENAITTIKSGKNLIKVDVRPILDDRNTLTLLKPGSKIFVIGRVEDDLILTCIAIFTAERLNIHEWEICSRLLSKSFHKEEK